MRPFAATWSASLKPEVRPPLRQLRRTHCPLPLPLHAHWRVLPASWCITPVRPAAFETASTAVAGRAFLRHQHVSPEGRQRRLWRQSNAAERSTAGRPRHANRTTKCLAECEGKPLPRLRFGAATAPRHYRIPATRCVPASPLRPRTTAHVVTGTLQPSVLHWQSQIRDGPSLACLSSESARLPGLIGFAHA